MTKRKKPKTPETPFERFAMLARKIVSVPKPESTAGHARKARTS